MNVALRIATGLSRISSSQRNFQKRVRPWLVACFGEQFAAPEHEREARFLEEAIELFQARGRTFEELVSVAKYVYARKIGEVPQEIGGVMMTLAALCEAAGYDMFECGEAELARVWTKVDAIREKQRNKPRHSPLPGIAPGDEVPENDWTPTEDQIEQACRNLCAKYDEMDEALKWRTRADARDWLDAWLRVLPKTSALRDDPTLS